MAKGLSAAAQQEEDEENRDRGNDQPEQRPADCAPFAFGFIRCFHDLAMVEGFWMNKLKHLWSILFASFWFVPAWIVASSMVLALALIEVDSSRSRDWMDDWPRLFGASAAGSREMLATIAGAMTTVVGVTFSMTLVALTLASSQYTSRVLRNFMGDHVTQVVLGIFAGIFTCSIIVLRTVRGDDDGGFVPSLSVTFSVVLAIAGTGTSLPLIATRTASCG